MPLVGGISIFLSLVVGALIWTTSEQVLININGEDALWVLLGCCGFVVTMGALDDRYSLSVASRLVAEILIAVIIIHTIDLRLIWLGDLIGTGQIKMGPTMSYIFTVIAIFGLLNAFNMLDGVDGLLASITILNTIFFHLITGVDFTLVGLYILSCIGAFLISNIGITPMVPKTFLGDSGSKLIGFIAVCFLLTAASGRVGDEKLINPITALFLVAVPLFDMVVVTLRRLANASSPFKGDNSHIHHLLIALNFKPRNVVLIIVSVSLAGTSLGLVLHQLNMPEYRQTQIYLLLFISYCLASNTIWRRVKATG